MKLTKIELRNVKGISKEFPLSPVTIVAKAANACGKTAIGDAVTLALLGYVPRLGKQTGSTMSLASERSMGVVATWEDGAVTTLGFNRVGQTVKKVFTGERFGPSTMLDLRSWMQSGTGKERANYIFARCGLDPSTFDFGSFRAVIEGVAVAKSAESDAVKADIDVALKDAVKRCRTKEYTVPEAVDAIIQSLDNLASLSNSEVKRLQGALEQILATITDAPTVDGISSEDARAQESTAVANLSTLREQSKAFANAQCRLDELLQERDAVEEDLPIAALKQAIEMRAADVDAARVKLASVPLGITEADKLHMAKTTADHSAADVDAKSLRRKIDALVITDSREAIDSAEATAKAKKAKLEEQITDSRRALEAGGHRPEEQPIEQYVADLGKAVTEAAVDVANAGSMKVALDTGVGRLQSEISDLRMKMARDLAHEVCPTCHSHGSAWHERYRSLAEDTIGTRQEQLDEEIAKRDVNGMQLEEAKKRQSDAKVKESVARQLKATIDRLRGEIVFIDTEIEGMARRRAELASMEQRKESLSREYDVVHTRVGELATLLSTAKESWKEKLDSDATRTELSQKIAAEQAAKQRLEEDLKARDAMEASITAARGALKEIPNPTDEEVESATLLAQKATAAVRDALNREQALRDHQTKKAEVESLRAKLETVTGIRAWLKLVVSQASAARQALIDRSIGPIIAKARRFTDGLLQWTLEYKDGEFGYTRGNGIWVTPENFSGYEERVAFAGIQIALTEEYPNRIVVVDELGTMIPENTLAYIDRIGELIRDGVIDQFIGICPDVSRFASLKDPNGYVSFIEL